MPVDVLELWKKNTVQSAFATTKCDMSKPKQPAVLTDDWPAACRKLPPVVAGSRLSVFIDRFYERLVALKADVIGVSKVAPWEIEMTNCKAMRRVPVPISNCLSGFRLVSESYDEALIKAACLVREMQKRNVFSVTFRKNLLKALHSSLGRLDSLMADWQMR